MGVVSAATYRVAGVRFRDALDVLGPFAGPCGVCGAHPDRRHRQADAIMGGLLAGEDPSVVAYEYADSGVPLDGVLLLAFTCLAADPRLHRVAHSQAARLDREVWAQ